jgi:outer membrane lipoprotein-sorting protein
MSNNRIYLLCLALVMTLLVSLTAALGQSGNAADLLKRIEANRQQINDMQQDGLIITETKFDGGVKRTETEFSTAFKRPKLLRIQIKGRSPMPMVSDGRWLWSFNERTRSYTQRSAPTKMSVGENLFGTLIPLQIGDTSLLVPIGQKLVKDLRFSGQEWLETNSGQKALCNLFEAEISDEVMSKLGEVKMKMWIDTNDLITWKVETTLIPKQLSQEREVKVTILTLSTKLNEGLPDSFFKFVPPSDAKQR